MKLTSLYLAENRYWRNIYSFEWHKN